MNVIQLTDSKQFYLNSTSKLGIKMNSTMNSKINFKNTPTTYVNISK